MVKNNIISSAYRKIPVNVSTILHVSPSGFNFVTTSSIHMVKRLGYGVTLSHAGCWLEEIRYVIRSTLNACTR